jgi:class 3 adenylate cyclase/pimeloyl-ACP methyl ester carboxylesterase
VSQPETRYTAVGGDRVAFQVLGEGPRDLVFNLGQWGHVDLIWEEPAFVRFLRRLASFSRVIVFDTRGTGLSDPRPQDGREVWKQAAEDLLAVMDAVSSKSVAILGPADVAHTALRFAATYPQRCSGLILVNATARLYEAPGYPEGLPIEEMSKYLEFVRKYSFTEKFSVKFNPSLAHDEHGRRWFAKLFRSSSSPRELMETRTITVSLDAREVLADVRVPTLIMHRPNCRSVPIAQGRYLADHIAGARFVELPGTDYFFIWETPDLVLDQVEEFMTGQRHGGEPDRMLTTVLFTDIVGSTGQAAKLGDAAWRALLDRHDNLLREQVGLFGGKVADHSGDGSLSTFENPRRAIDCALALQTALAAIGLEIRAGVHFGEVEKRADGGVGGVNVHIGARVMAIAKTGEVLVSRTVRDILGGSRYGFQDRGTHELKGVPDGWQVYAVGQREDP